MGGTHPNEQFPLDLAENLQRYSLPHVDGMIVNERARRQRKRFTDVDMQLSYPGDPNSVLYEERRAAEVLEMARNGYDMVIDMHSGLPGSKFADAGMISYDRVYDSSAGLDPDIFRFLKNVIGVRNIMMSTWSPISKFVSGLSMEIDVKSHRANIGYWRRSLNILAESDDIGDATMHDFAFWRLLVGRDIGTREQKRRLALPDIMPLLEEPFPRVTAADFGETDPEIANAEVYAFAWGSKNPKYYGELAVRMSPPPAVQNILPM